MLPGWAIGYVRHGRVHAERDRRRARTLAGGFHYGYLYVNQTRGAHHRHPGRHRLGRHRRRVLRAPEPAAAPAEPRRRQRGAHGQDGQAHRVDADDHARSPSWRRSASSPTSIRAERPDLATRDERGADRPGPLDGPPAAPRVGPQLLHRQQPGGDRPGRHRLARRRGRPDADDPAHRQRRRRRLGAPVLRAVGPLARGARRRRRWPRPSTPATTACSSGCATEQPALRDRASTPSCTSSATAARASGTPAWTRGRPSRSCRSR